jgi:hypothetical protein
MMGNDERSGSSSRINWPAKLSAGVGTGVGVATGYVLSLQAIKLTGLEGFWPWIVVFVGGGGGAFLGQFAGSRMFRRPPGNGPRA